MALNQIPYTNVHELNLDWVLAEIKKFDAYITSIKEIIDQLADYYATVDHLQDEVQALHNEVNTYSGRITDLESSIVIIQNRITELKNDLTDLIEEEANRRKAGDADLQHQIDQIKTAIADVNALRAYIEAVYKSLRLYINNSISLSEYRLYSYINEKVGDLQREIDEIHEMLLHIAINVYNAEAYSYSPDGRIDFDLNNRLIYQNLGNNLTVEEYASLGLTVAQYAAHGLTEKQYLEQGKRWLHFDHIFMPVSGKRQSHENALSDVVTTFANTLTCGSYTDLELTVEEYTALDLTTKQYLFLDQNLALNNFVMSNANSTGITVDQYNSLQIKEV